jgi:RNA polymerase sigma-54 factor
MREAADKSWRIELNPDALPRILVNRDYYAEVSRAGLSATKRPS